MIRSLLYSLLLGFIFFSAELVAQDNTISIGHRSTIHSNVLNEDRQLLIHLPDSYHPEVTTGSYPLIILLDGYSHFEITTATVDFLSSRRNRIVPEMVVVAIENVDRERDFTFTKIQTKRENTMGGGRNFLQFIADELIPDLKESYPINDEAFLIGHSLGGLFALNTYFENDTTFDARIAIDPSTWWDEEQLQQKAAGLEVQQLKKKLFIATAGQTNYERNIKKHELLLTALNTRLAQVMRVVYDEEDHHSVPLPALHNGLRYIFNESAKE